MASFDELQWKEWRDFTGGLYERSNDRECAENGLLECQDCFPLPDGGLRAFAAFTPVSMSGIPAADTVVLGVWHVPPRLAFPFYTQTLSFDGTSAGSHTWTGLSIQSTDIAGTSWATYHSVNNITAMGMAIRVEGYRFSGSTGFWGVSNFPVTESTAAAGSTAGMWRFNHTTALLMYPDATPLGAWVYQDRVLNITNSSQSVLQDVRYTEPFSTATPSTANIITPNEQTQTQISWLSAFPPSDLLAHASELGVIDIQGDITSPIIRTQGFYHNWTLSFPVVTEKGVVFVVEDEGVYVFDGSSYNYLSPQIIGSPMNGALLARQNGSSFQGNFEMDLKLQLGYVEHWLLCGNGYVMDMRTGAWFKFTPPEAHPRYWAVDNRLGQMVYSTDGNTATMTNSLMFSAATNEKNWTRAATTSFTLPLIYLQGQQTVLREIEYHLNVFRANSTLSVTITHPDPSGVSTSETLSTITLAATGPQKVRVGVDGHPADWWKIRTVLASGAAGSEAPMVEKVVTGTADATRYTKAN